MTGLLRIERASGPVLVPFGPDDVQDALRLRDRFAVEESVRSGRRRVEIVPADGGAR
ncbi:hypothetical protein AB0K35_28460 [Micromonospora sp. NPDC053740]|uniref:hypothetical protein n=1 Tax=Micromonospora sp. NPDC053740 TaxID=3155173 RepID=UPI003421547E